MSPPALLRTARLPRRIHRRLRPGSRLLPLCVPLCLVVAACFHPSAAQDDPFPSDPEIWSDLGTPARAAAWGDFQRDGRLDLALTTPPRVLVEQGGRWRTVWGLDVGSNRAIALGDANGDGRLDMVCGYLDRRNTLYLNGDEMLEGSPAWDSAPSNGTTSLALGDVDNDGDLDLVCGNSYDANAVYRNIGGSHCFAEEPEWLSDPAAPTQDVALGDFNGDGRIDLVCANLNQPNALYLNQGSDDLFVRIPSWTASEAEWTYDVALGDIDGDGRLDVVCANRNQPTTLYLNGPEGLSRSPSWFCGGEPSDTRGVALGDLDSDGDLDLVCTSLDAGNYIVWNQDGMLAENPGWISSERFYSWKVGIGDADGDGSLDLAFAGGGRSVLYLNQQTPLFSSQPTWIAAEQDPTSDLALADVNGDALLDLVVANSHGEPNALYRNLAGQLPLHPDHMFGPGYDSRELALGDVNGDRLPEAAFANGPDPQAVYFNTGGRFASEPLWSEEAWQEGRDVAFGDMDNDGDLDLVLGTDDSAVMYRGFGGFLASEWAWHPTAGWRSHQVGLCDLDRNGYLDVLTLGLGRAALFPNAAGGIATWPSWAVERVDATLLALGDVNGDGFADLFLGAGQSALYLNGAEGLATAPDWVTDGTDELRRCAMADVDGDGWLDLVCGAWEHNLLYRNQGRDGLFSSEASWTAGFPADTRGIALGDVDADGDLDLVCGAGGPNGAPAANFMHAGLRNPPFRGDPQSPTNHLPNSPAYVRFVHVEEVGLNHLRIHLRAIDVESDPVSIHGECWLHGNPIPYPVDFGAGDATVGPLPSSPAGVVHTLDWNIAEFPFDDREVVLHLLVISHPSQAGDVQRLARYQRSVGRLQPHRPAIASPIEVLRFPSVTHGDTVWATCPIENAGNLPLTLEAFDLPDSSLRVAQSPPVSVTPGEVFELEIEFGPPDSVNVFGELGIHSDDPLQPVHTVPIETDVLRLAVTAHPLIPEGELAPLGEALTVIMAPAPGVSMDGGVLCHRPIGSGANFECIDFERSWEEYIAVIPGRAVTEAGLEYYIRVYNGDVEALLPPRAPEFLFQQEIAAPAECYSSAEPNMGSGFQAGLPIAIEASLPQGAELVEGWLHFRRGGEDEARAVRLVAGATAGRWVAEIPGSSCGERGVQYWVSMTTRTSILTDPPDMPEQSPHELRITVPNLEERDNGPAGRYRMVAVPLDFGDAFGGTLADLLEDQEPFGAYDTLRWRAFRYLADQQAYVELDEPGAAEQFRPEPGRGFWLMATSPGRIATAPASGVSTPAAAPYEIPLVPGWNQVGNPFAFAVAWDSVLVDSCTWQEARDQGVVEPAVPWLLEERSYGDRVVVLDPFASCWVRLTSTSGATLRVPPLEAPPGDRRTALAGSPQDLPSPERPRVATRAGALSSTTEPAARADGWMLGVQARSGDFLDRRSSLGVREGAASSWDRYDRADPPLPPGDALSVHFPHATWEQNPGVYAVDVRPPLAQFRGPLGGSTTGGTPVDGWAWEFDVAKSFTRGRPEEVELRFAHTDQIPDSIRLRLIDRELDVILDPRERPSYTYFERLRAVQTYGVSTRFLFLAGSDAFIDVEGNPLASRPGVTRLHAAIPNPLWSSALLRYDLARSGRVDLRIFDLRGGLIRTLQTGAQPAGRYSVRWDGRDDRGYMAPQGAYFCRLKSADGSRVRKLMLIR
ncbi:MAG: hypothetical protein GF330_12040 [Candidatus Eisenbacteria bacterium]|nr:hypothetical protein [Candidatus Eisenbacteria bacterium]